LCLSALLRLESKLIVAACRDASVRKCMNSEIPLITLVSLHAATISLYSSLKRADRHKHKMMTTITFHICNLFHLCRYRYARMLRHVERGKNLSGPTDIQIMPELVAVSGIWYLFYGYQWSKF
jgi:hypothetical protein